MKDKAGLKDIIFFAIVIIMAGLCIYGKETGSFPVKKEQKPEKTIVGVHVKGEVNNPGYYELDYGSRIKDAIKVAGGASAAADVNKVNLAEKLRDGQAVVIPSAANGEQTAQPASDGKVNINTASELELQTVSGIGEATAKSIIAYREAHGGFKKLTELKKIDGIGTKKLEKMKDYIKLTD